MQPATTTMAEEAPPTRRRREEGEDSARASVGTSGEDDDAPAQDQQRDVYLSLKHPTYKKIMFDKFQEMERGTAAGGNAVMAKAVLRTFEKRGGRRFFKLLPRDGRRYTEVDRDAALQKIEKDFSRRDETYCHWGASAEKRRESVLARRRKSREWRQKKASSSEPTNLMEPSEDDGYGYWCFVCNDGGELLICDHCTNVCHLGCHNPKWKEEPDEFKCLECSSHLKTNDEVYAFHWKWDGGKHQFASDLGTIVSVSYEKQKDRVSRFCKVQLLDSGDCAEVEVEDLFVVPKDKHRSDGVYGEGDKVYAPWWPKKGPPKWYAGTVLGRAQKSETSPGTYSVQFDVRGKRDGIDWEHLIPKLDHFSEGEDQNVDTSPFMDGGAAGTSAARDDHKAKKTGGRKEEEVGNQKVRATGKRKTAELKGSGGTQASSNKWNLPPNEAEDLRSADAPRTKRRRHSDERGNDPLDGAEDIPASLASGDVLQDGQGGEAARTTTIGGEKVFLSLKDAAYKKAMFEQFQKIGLEAINNGKSKTMAEEVLGKFEKKGCGRYFRLTPDKKSGYKEVDRDAALDKIERDFGRRKETYHYWGTSAEKSWELVLAKRQRKRETAARQELHVSWELTKEEDLSKDPDGYGHWCFICKDGGDLLLCDHCTNACHLECHNPKWKEAPDEFKCLECSSQLKRSDEAYAFDWKGDGNERRFASALGTIVSFGYAKQKDKLRRFCRVQLLVSGDCAEVEDIFVVPKDKYHDGREYREGDRVYAPWPSKKGDPKWYAGTVLGRVQKSGTSPVTYFVKFDNSGKRDGIDEMHLIPKLDHFSEGEDPHVDECPTGKPEIMRENGHDTLLPSQRSDDFADDKCSRTDEERSSTSSPESTGSNEPCPLEAGKEREEMSENSNGGDVTFYRELCQKLTKKVHKLREKNNGLKDRNESLTQRLANETAEKESVQRELASLRQELARKRSVH